MIAQEVGLVQEWHQALNTGNPEKLAALVSTDVRMGGPRGSIKGVEALLQWIDRANITLTPKRYFKRDHLVGVEALGTWHDPETGEVTGQQEVTTVFTVKDQLISQLFRYDSREEALASFGLVEADEVLV
ncbi:MAG: nuclear transport factor 2 family protein [Cyclobacteriaceae bacterium]